ncbi:PucR family transcriptional regulator [Cohnella sp.]|uniref:PucR family transcriptional regulator n=1 Tax=Cohnella sp. TaxID=1883426 RepID=UPI00356A42C3
MNMTVEQALSVYPLSEGKLIAGSAGINRIIKAVNVMDAPDIADWIKEGEMVFTTGYLIKDRPEDASHLLNKLHHLGSSGLGIKLGRFWQTIPEPLIEQANSLGFPLIELPFQFTFSDQMNGLFREEMKRNTSDLQDLLDKQIRLMRFALHSGHIKLLFDSVSEVIGYPIAIIGSRGQIMYNSSEIPDNDLLAKWPWPQHHQCLKTEEWQAFRVPLLKQSRCTGYVLFFYSHLMISALEESLYLQAAELISYHMNFKFEDYFELSAERDFGLLIKRYLKNGLPLETLAEYSARWEIDVFHQSYQCVLTDLPTPQSEGARGDLLESLKTEFLSHSPLQELKGIHVVLEEGLLSVFPDAAGDRESAILSALGSCLNGLKTETANIPRAAVSSLKKKQSQLLDAFNECKESHRLIVELGVSDRIVKFETLDLVFVFEQVSRERMQKFCDRWLGGLSSRDPEYAREMLRTLETYLDCDGQLNETAKKLYIHRNTATYRIEKLGEILDIDFKKVNDLLRLKIAFMFKRMLTQDSLSAERIR